MLSHSVNNLLRAMKRPYWPVAERIKLSIPVSVRYIAQFENIASTHAREQGYDGRGLRPHPPREPEAHRRHALLQHGDWVESCSALVEKHNGELELLRWPLSAQVAGKPAGELVADAA